MIVVAQNLTSKELFITSLNIIHTNCIITIITSDVDETEVLLSLGYSPAINESFDEHSTTYPKFDGLGYRRSLHDNLP